MGLKFAPVQVIDDVGIFEIGVSVSDSKLQVYQSFKLTATNSPPYFIKDVPQDLIINFNKTYEYNLPPYKDDEGNAITIMIESKPRGVAEFITIDQIGGTIMFNPQRWSQLRDYDIELTLSDGSPTYLPIKFKLRVINNAPYFFSKI